MAEIIDNGLDVHAYADSASSGSSDAVPALSPAQDMDVVDKRDHGDIDAGESDVERVPYVAPAQTGDIGTDIALIDEPVAQEEVPDIPEPKTKSITQVTAEIILDYSTENLLRYEQSGAYAVRVFDDGTEERVAWSEVADPRPEKQHAELLVATKANVDAFKQEMHAFKNSAEATYATKTEVDQTTGTITETFAATYLSKEDADSTLATKTELQRGIEGVTSTMTQNYATKDEAKAGTRPNLSPFFSHPLEDYALYKTNTVGSEWTNPDAYWLIDKTSGDWNRTGNYTLSVTEIGNGWAHVKMKNNTSSSQRFDFFVTEPLDHKEGTDYTWLFEIKDNMSENVTSANHFYIVQMNQNYAKNCWFWGGNITKLLEGKRNGAQVNLYADFPPNTAGVYRQRFMKKTEATGSTRWNADADMRTTALLVFLAPANNDLDFKIRVSLYEGEYMGEYKPYVPDERKLATLSQLQQTAESISATVSTNYSSIQTALESMQEQIDGAKDSWYYDTDPTATGEPNSAWTTEADKAAHEGDTYVNTETNQMWRWLKKNNVWGWQQVQDSAAAEALAKANANANAITQIKNDYVTKAAQTITDDAIRQSVTDNLTTAKTYASGLVSTEKTERESAISTLADNITLEVGRTYATKTENQASTHPNITPFFERGFTYYNATTNPDSIFYQTHAGNGGNKSVSNTEGIHALFDEEHDSVTWPLLPERGWAHITLDSRTSAGNDGSKNCYMNLMLAFGKLNVEEDKQYTWLCEVRNLTWEGASGKYLTVCPSIGNATFDKLSTANQTSMRTTTDADLRCQVTAKADFSMLAGTCDTRGYAYIPTGCYADFWLRVSLYEGTYTGSFKPYVDSELEINRRIGAQLKITEDGIYQTVADSYSTKTETDNKLNALTIGGRNLFIRSTCVNGHLSTTGTLTADDGTKTMTSDYIPVEPNTAYQFSVWSELAPIAALNKQPWRCLQFFDSSKAFISSAVRNQSNVATYKLSVTTPQTAAYVRISSRWLQSGYEYSKVKFERGTKPTDWTPAPEDTDSAISAVSGDLSSYKTTVSQTYTTQTTFNTTVNGINANVSDANSKITKEISDRKTAISQEVTDRNTAITAAKNEINLAVSQTYAKQTEVQNLGNMLKDWNAVDANGNPTLAKVDGPAPRYWSDSGHTQVTPSLFKVTDPPEQDIVLGARFVCDGTYNGVRYRTLAFYQSSANHWDWLPYDAGDYTVSFWARCTEGDGNKCRAWVRIRTNTATAENQAQNMGYANLTDRWQHYVIPCHIYARPTNNTPVIWIGPHFAANTAGTVEMCGFKMVAGKSAEQVSSEVTAQQASIDLLAGSIRSLAQGGTTYTDPSGATVTSQMGTTVTQDTQSVQTAIKQAVSSVKVEYGTSSSSTTQPTSWSTASPTWSAGKYIWQKTTTTTGIGAEAKTTTTVVCIQGAKGQDGEPGTAGTNSATVILYQRATSSPAVPTGNVTYTFATGAVSGSLGSWTKELPSGTNPVWAISATATAATATDTIAKTEWSTPIKLVENGAKGDAGATGAAGAAGANGLNQATVFLYRRAQSLPAQPTTASTYTFATGKLSSIPSGWSQSIPAANGYPCWVTTAAAISQGASVSIAASAWAAVTKLVEDGQDGTPGADAYTVFLDDENHTFAGSATAAIAASATVRAYGYKGATQMAVTVGTITGLPTGMTASISNNSTTSASITISVTTSLTTKQGTLTIPLTVDGKSFTKKLTWSLALAGTKGDTGATGAAGAAATAYTLIVSAAAIQKTQAGAYTPTSITLSAKSQTGASSLVAYAGRFKVETTTNGTSWTAAYTSSANESSYTYTVPASIKAIRCSLYLAGGTTTLLDQQIVPIVSDGAKGDKGDDGEDGQMLFATCSTAAGTAAKVATLQGGATLTTSDLKAGVTVAVNFTNLNSAANATLNVGGSGAKTIKALNANLKASDPLNWTANSTLIFVFDGSYWQMDGADARNKASLALDMATETQTIVRQYGQGVLVAKTGNKLGALVNADGSFDVVAVTWSGNTPTASTVHSRFGLDSAIIGRQVSGQRSIQINSSGLTVFDNTTPVASFGPSSITLGKVASGSRNVRIDTNGLTVQDNTTQLAKFGASESVVGKVASGSKNILTNSSGMYIRDNTTNIASFTPSAIAMNAGGVSAVSIQSYESKSVSDSLTPEDLLLVSKGSYHDFTGIPAPRNDTASTVTLYAFVRDKYNNINYAYKATLSWNTGTTSQQTSNFTDQTTGKSITGLTVKLTKPSATATTATLRVTLAASPSFHSLETLEYTINTGKPGGSLKLNVGGTMRNVVTEEELDRYMLRQLWFRSIIGRIGGCEDQNEYQSERISSLSQTVASLGNTVNRTVLYSSTASAGTLTMSGSAADYTHMVIFYNLNGKTNGVGSPAKSVEIYSPNNKYVTLDGVFMANDSTMQIRSETFLISGNKITYQQTKGGYVNDSTSGRGTKVTLDYGVYITRVEAW